jgi:hypothetical protein
MLFSEAHYCHFQDASVKTYCPAPHTAPQRSSPGYAHPPHGKYWDNARVRAHAAKGDALPSRTADNPRAACNQQRRQLGCKSIVPLHKTGAVPWLRF